MSGENAISKWGTIWDDKVLDKGLVLWKRGETNENWIAQYKCILDHVPFPDFEPSKPLKIFIPLCGDAKFVWYAWSQGCHVVGLDIVPQAVKHLRLQFGPDEDWESSQVPTGKKWTFKDKRAVIYESDMFQEYPELCEYFDVVMDKDALGALPKDLRLPYGEMLSKYLRKGGLLYSETKFLLTDDLESGPPFHLPNESVKDCFPKLNYLKGLGEIYEWPSEFNKQLSHILRKDPK